MSTVRLTKAVRNQITRSCDVMFAKRLKEAETFFMDIAELATMIYETWLEQQTFAYHWAAIPPEHMQLTNTVDIRFLNGWTPDTVKLQLPNPKPMSLEVYQLGGYDLVDPKFDQVVERWKAWQANKKALAAEAMQFKSKVAKFVEQHTTLKSALLEWPQLWTVVPDNLRTLHNIEARPETRRTILRKSGHDMTEVTGTIVATRMINAVID